MQGIRLNMIKRIGYHPFNNTQNIRLDWNDARSACQRINKADLTSIHNFEEMRHIYQLIIFNNERGGAANIFPHIGMWIGMRRDQNVIYTLC